MSEHVSTEETILEEIVGSQSPWARETDIQAAAELLAQRMTDSGVDDETFTIQMLNDALSTGRDMAKVLGGRPPTPGSTPAPQAGLPGQVSFVPGEFGQPRGLVMPFSPGGFNVQYPPGVSPLIQGPYTQGQ